MTNVTGTASVAWPYACVASENQVQGCVRLGNPELDRGILDLQSSTTSENGLCSSFNKFLLQPSF